MKKVLLFLICFWGICTVHADTIFENATFSKCVDGDTVYLLVEGIEKKYRLLAVDTPETVHPSKDVQLYGKDASEYTCNALTSAKEIIVEYESGTLVDKYDRTLAWLWADGVLIQKSLVSIGYAEVAYIYGDYRYTDALCLIQKYAKDEKIGIWVEEREEGYCATIDLLNVKDNIIYDDIASLTDQEKKIQNTINNLEETEDKVSTFFDKNGNLLSNIYLYGFIAIAIIYVIYKEVKK